MKIWNRLKLIGPGFKLGVEEPAREAYCAYLILLQLTDLKEIQREQLLHPESTGLPEDVRDESTVLHSSYIHGEEIAN